MKRGLIIFTDIEGRCKSSLHDITLAIYGICSISNKKVKIDKTFSPASYISIIKDIRVVDGGDKLIQKKLDYQLNYIMKQEEADSLLINSWSGHDYRVLKDFFYNYEYQWIDLLSWSKQIAKGKIVDFSIKSLLSRYKSMETQKHTAFMDTVHMVKICNCILKDIDKQYRKQEITIEGEKKVNIKPIFTNSTILDHVIFNKKNLNKLNLEWQGERQAGYDYIKQKDLWYKVRKGWEKSLYKGEEGKGLGLYIYEPYNQKFKMIKGKKKVELLFSFLK